MCIIGTKTSDRMKKAIIFLIIFLFFIPHFNHANKDNGEWFKTYGMQGVERFYDIEKAEDGYVMVGTTTSYGGWWDAWFVKVDKNGNLIRSKSYGGRKEDIAQSIIAIDDGYLIAGYTASYAKYGYDLWLIKIDKYGNEIWNRTYNRGKEDFGGYVCKAEDGYLIAGWDAEEDDIWVVKVDKEGNEVWNKTYGGKNHEKVKDIIQTKDGYIMAGTTDSYGAGL